ncbi:MAG: RHS repeat-associated core domain-containing protein, partial [Bacteroidetes bacterium]|nr:RHS repeat-associated core domain-containing protein [Bacteroidota bacterium]
ELSNHLGNVLVTVSDRKLHVSAGGTTVDYYNADVITATDYYPFGLDMPGRKFGAAGRYGFNGKERDKDMNSLTAYDYGFRIYNPAIGKFLSVDPLTQEYPWFTPYQFAANMPVWAVDIDGLESDKPEANKNESASTSNSSGGLLNRFLNLVQDGQSGKLQADILVGAGKAAKDATVGTVVGAWNLVTLNPSTYNSIASFALAVNTSTSIDGAESRKLMDMSFGLNSQTTYDALKYKADVSKWTNEDWSYNVTTAGIAFFGPKAVGKGVGLAKSIKIPVGADYTANMAATDYIVLESMKPSKPSFKVVSAMESNGIITLDVNGPHYPKNINSNLGLAGASAERWPLLQCAEPKALNKTLNLGMKKSTVSSSTFGISSNIKYSGEGIFSDFRYLKKIVYPKAPCTNCNILLQGTKGR